jgi:hypothetical protein
MRAMLIVALITSVAFLSACSSTTRTSTSTQADPGSTTTQPTLPSTTARRLAPEPSEPPALVVSSNGSTATVPPFDYCWTPATSTTGVCADSFGSEIPTPITVDTPTAEIDWVQDGELTAWVRSDEPECGPQLSLEPAGPGHWDLAMPPHAGTYRVTLAGTAPEGDTGFALQVTSLVDGPPVRPIVAVWWPDIDDPFALSVDITGVDSCSDVVLEITSTKGLTTELTMELYESDRRCGPSEGEVTLDDRTALGAAPYTVTLGVTDATQRYEIAWEWPADLNGGDTLKGTMQPQD